MPLFALDRVRNALISQVGELLWETVRENLVRSSIDHPPIQATNADLVAAFDRARPRYNVIGSLLSSPPEQTGADIGTGFGFLPVGLARQGHRVRATETNRDIATFASSCGVSVEPYIIGQTAPPFPPDSLDFVILADVLEHLKLSPVHVLGELTDLLRPGGRFLLTTPNIARLSHIETLASGENFLEPFPEHVPFGADATDYVEHVREYSIREVVEAMEGVGLGIHQVLMTGWGEVGYNPAPNPFVNEIIVVDARK